MRGWRCCSTHAWFAHCVEATGQLYAPVACICCGKSPRYTLARKVGGLQSRFGCYGVEANWNVMAYAQKPEFVFRRNGRVHLNRRGRQFSRLLAAEVCASAVVMLHAPCSEVVWRVLATHTIRQFPLSLPLPCVTVCHHVSTAVYRKSLYVGWPARRVTTLPTELYELVICDRLEIKT